MNTMKVASFAFVSLLAVACTPIGNARIVKETKSGGEIALEGSREIAQQKADLAMNAKCPGGFEVDEAGETSVGSTTSSETQNRSSRSGIILGNPSSSSTQQVSRELTEWRIKYHCKGTEPEEKAAPAGEVKKEGFVQHTFVVRF